MCHKLTLFERAKEYTDIGIHRFVFPPHTEGWTLRPCNALKFSNISEYLLSNLQDAALHKLVFTIFGTVDCGAVMIDRKLLLVNHGTEYHNQAIIEDNSESF